MKDKVHTVDSIDYWGVPGGRTITPHTFKFLKESQDSLCIKAYNLHFDSAKNIQTTDILCVLLFLFHRYRRGRERRINHILSLLGHLRVRIYDIQETSRKIQLKTYLEKKEFDRAERLLIASEEGSLLVWWRNCIYKYKILKNTARSIIKLKEVDNMWSEITHLFLSYTTEEPEP